MNEFMKAAIEEARKGFNHDHGGPFGAVIIRDGVQIANAHNEVLKTNDPTAHAEILAITEGVVSRVELTDDQDPRPLGPSKDEVVLIGIADVAVLQQNFRTPHVRLTIRIRVPI